jgi:hypothetical protein
MRWTFRSTREQVRLTHDVLDELQKRAGNVSDEAEAEKALADTNAWIDFLEEVRRFEQGGEDPRRLPVVREGGKTYHDFHRLSKNGYAIIYDVDERTMTATAVLLYRTTSDIQRAAKYFRLEPLGLFLTNAVLRLRQGTSIIWLCIGPSLISLACGIIGVIRAVHMHNVNEGQRGGVFGTIIPIVFLLFNLGIERKVERVDGKTSIGPSGGKGLEARLDQLENALNDKRTSRIQDRANAIASIIGTIFWGLGDWFAGWFM